MVVKVHCGTVLGNEFAAMLKMRPPKSPTMQFKTILTRSPAQPRSGECRIAKAKDNASIAASCAEVPLASHEILYCFQIIARKAKRRSKA